ncbi:hypothetical protein VSS74_02760 [Conexibacter stalactiti]|uniref:CARDB domain-containing protein n=1 Tax=Conexibacter stalactiti TaxID=1940611 RepID=A0ABU4HKL5_9ACTN|nr:hypothetical protein [Conexibacter stalactiti]MDW5593242.1 hypothetical protein [Conexibacter stalactiti]MEC5033883.1 hypothetical protein [Conexibacter stalactiti]
MLVRRLVAAGAVVVVLVLMVVLVRGCVNSGREQALKDYNREVTSLMQQSRSDVSTPLFAALTGAAGQRGEQVTETIAQLRAVAERQLDSARALDAPDQVADAQHNLELLLSLREDGVRVIADRIQQAIGTSASAQTALDLIAGQMQAFNASDVVYSQRVAPYVKQALEDAGIPATYSGETGETVLPYSDFLPNIGWMDPANVARALGTSSASADDSGRPAPGLHGHQIDSVSVGGTTLEPGGSATLPADPPPTFDVSFTNGGEHDEQNVRVVVEISGGGGSPISAETVVATTTAGEAATASVAFREPPPTGGVANIRVTIEPVPGEEGLDNNSQTYSALFE